MSDRNENLFTFLKKTKWALLWALLIFILCSIPGHDIPHIRFLELLSFDKFVHAGIFFVQALLTAKSFSIQNKFLSLKKYALAVSLVLCVAYGGLLEIMQGACFVERTADVFDFIANSFGSLMAILFFRKLEKRFLFFIT